MRRIKVGIASIDNTVGAVRTTTDSAIAYARQMADAGCTVGVFQEQLLGGYPAEDLVQFGDFVPTQMEHLFHFARRTAEHDTVFVLGLTVSRKGFLYNANAVVYKGTVLGIVPKEHLPTYGVFYEKRVFAAGAAGMYDEVEGVPFGDIVFTFPFGTMATCVCEDAWVPDGPLARRARAELQVVTNASPNRVGVLDTRRQMLATRSADHECTLVAAYAAGGNDSLVFDGGGFCFQNGQLIGEAPRFTEGITVFEVDLSRTERMRNQNATWRTRHEHQKNESLAPKVITVSAGPRSLANAPSRAFAERFSFLPNDFFARAQVLDDIEQTIIRGLDGYFSKTKAFKKILISLSGGKDSALTLILAWRWACTFAVGESSASQKAIVRSLVYCLSQPTHFNSDETKSIARDMAAELGAEFAEESIETALEGEETVLWKLASHDVSTKTLGNVQARIRAMRMWNLSNMMQGLWLQTGNMSEKAVGYTTIGGDLMGGYSLIGNLPKTVVEALLVHLGKKYGIKSVDALMKTRASAELAEGQFDEDELMPFPVLDMCFLLFAGEMYNPADMYRIIRARWTDQELRAMYPTFEAPHVRVWIERFVMLFRTSIYKWVQAPQAVHIGSLDLDRERALQIPAVHSDEFLQRSNGHLRAIG